MQVTRATGIPMRLDEYESFVAIDFETTGLDPATDRIIEIGAVRFDARGIELSSFETLVATETPSHPRAFAVHGIADADRVAAPDSATALQALLDFLGEPEQCVMLAHNAGFDAAFLSTELSRAGLSVPDYRMIDTLALSRCVFPESRGHGLDALARGLGFDRSGAHRASADSRRVMQLWLEMRRRSPVVETSVALFKLQEPDDLSTVPEGWSDLIRAVRERRAIRMAYAGGSRGPAPRAVSPRRFVTRAGVSFVVAFCHLDECEKEFRLDRVLRYELIDGGLVR
ncbi:MAG: exonuclease domain-containing protein [Isosphaeraceae bacterium]|nr:exonuclease domain-containing protein [Isosphaeraceae bacterium]